MQAYAVFEDIEFEIKRLLRGANRSVRICVAWINCQTYANVFDSLLKKGVSIELICHDDMFNAKTIAYLPGGVKRYAMRPRLSAAYMHNKFCLIDEEIVINGSYNWSRTARQSFENVVVMRGSYSLVKSFLHEFYDLIAFSESEKGHVFQRCPICMSYQYHLGILGSESGKYSESKVDIWAICCANQHAVRLGEQYEQFFAAQYGLDSEGKDGDEPECVQSMLELFRRERDLIGRLHAYFTKHRSIQIHAIGSVTILNEHEHLKWGEEPEYCVHIGWRDMLYRKLIPQVLYDDGAGIERVINEYH